MTFQHALTSIQKRTLPACLRDIMMIRGTPGTNAGAYGAVLLIKQQMKDSVMR